MADLTANLQATPADIAAVSAVLKEVYPSDELEKQFYDQLNLLDMFEETTEYTDSNGDKAVLFLRTGRGGGISARAIGEKLMPADHRRYANVEYNYTNHYVQIAVNGPVVARMKSNRTSAIRHIDDEISQSLEDQQRDWVRQLHGAGDAVIAASLPALASTAVWVPLGAANHWAVERGFLYPGQSVDIGTAAAPTSSTGGNPIIAVDATVGAPKIKLANQTTVTAGHSVSLAGNRSTDQAQRELNGLGNMFGTGTFAGIDPTVDGNQFWQSKIQGNSGTARALSIDILLGGLRALRQGGKYPDFLFGDLIQEQKYYNLLQGQVRFAGEGNLQSGGTEGLAFAKIKGGFVGDPDCKPGSVWLGRKDAIRRFSAGPVAWQNQTEGGSILHWRPDYDQFTARAAKYWQLGLVRRNTLARIDDLNS